MLYRMKGVEGYDAGKRVTGCKRYLLIDTDGRLLLTAVSPASLHNSHGGTALLAMSRGLWLLNALLCSLSGVGDRAILRLVRLMLSGCVTRHSAGRCQQDDREPVR
jgi:hypothetical protein